MVVFLSAAAACQADISEMWCPETCRSGARHLESSQNGSMDGENIDVIVICSMVHWIDPAEPAVSILFIGAMRTGIFRF